MPDWGWGVGLIVAVAALFVAISRVGRQIKPDERKTDNDEWLREGEDGD
jgi:hypothetical protein